MDINGRSLPETVLLSIRGRKARKANATPRKHVEGAQMVVASYNVHKCIGTDRRFDPERTARVIRLAEKELRQPYPGSYYSMQVTRNQCSRVWKSIPPRNEKESPSLESRPFTTTVQPVS